MADIIKPDLCIIGAGALGIQLAIAARQDGAEVVLVDRGPEPGDAPRQRLQRQALLETAARAHALRSASQVGIDAAEPKLNFRAIAEHVTRVADAAAPRDSAQRLRAMGITVLAGEASFADRNSLRVGAETVRAALYLLAGGFRPLVPPIAGLEQSGFFTPDAIAQNVRKISHLLVVGGTAEAIELAQAYRRLGSDVTLVPQGEMLAGFDREAVAVLERELFAEGVAILEGSEVTAVNARSQGIGIDVRLSNGQSQPLDVSHILLALGQVPDLDPALLEKARLKPDPDRAFLPLLDANGQTSARHIVAVGATAGHHDPAFVDLQARAALARLTGGKTRFQAAQALLHVMTDPPIAQVGFVDGSGSLPTGATIGRISLGETEVARARGASTGLLKAVASARGQVLGAVMTGAGAIDTIAIMAAAIAHKIPLADLGQSGLPPNAAAAAVAVLARETSGPKPRRRRPSAATALRRLLP